MIGEHPRMLSNDRKTHLDETGGWKALPGMKSICYCHQDRIQETTPVPCCIPITFSPGYQHIIILGQAMFAYCAIFVYLFENGP